jgi:hypothetical protein
MMSSQLPAGTNWPCAFIAHPVGVCIQLLTLRIQKADMAVPAATIRVARKWSLLPTRSSPNSITPRNPASRKKAVRTS